MKPALLLLSLSLLVVACNTQPNIKPPGNGAANGGTTNGGATGSNPGTGTSSGGNVGGAASSGTSADDVPTVARAKRPAAPNCAAGSLAQQLSGGNLMNLRYQTVTHSLRAQDASADTLLDLLFETRKVLNTRYNGYSTVDLQALHETWETQFRKSLGNLNGAITDAADPLMSKYLGAINDEHTFYMTAESLKANSDQGGGANTPTPVFGFDQFPVPGEDGAVLTDVIDASPAQKAGLQRGDTLLSVNGKAFGGNPSDAADRYAALLAKAVKAGGEVSFEVRRAEQTGTVKVTPEIISSGSLPWAYINDNTNTVVLRIPTFNTQGVAQRVHDLVHAVQQRGATSLILDLRDNGGGLLSEATGVSAAFTPRLAGQLLEDLDANDTTFAYKNGSVQINTVCEGLVGTLPIQQPAVWKGQVAVLVNAASASGSEIVTTTLQRAGAIALGQKTLGVGNTATYVLGLPGKRGLSITWSRSRMLGGSGEYLKERVTPDFNVADNLNQLAHGHDLALEKAIEELQ